MASRKVLAKAAAVRHLKQQQNSTMPQQPQLQTEPSNQAQFSRQQVQSAGTDSSSSSSFGRKVVSGDSSVSGRMSGFAESVSSTQSVLRGTEVQETQNTKPSPIVNVSMLYQFISLLLGKK